MALEGTLRDFSLADIFQLIGLQRKTGVLTLRSSEDVVTISFMDGRVVAADSLNKRLEDRLGQVLLRCELVTQDGLAQALRIQMETLERLGHILLREGLITREQLRQAIEQQILQIVYRVFRWADGDYHFSQETTIDYDAELVTPISAESVLMEGARMLDEWPIVEKRLADRSAVYVQAVPSSQLTVATLEELEELESFELGDEAPPPVVPANRVTPAEASVLKLLNGLNSVEEVVRRSPLGEFDTCKALYTLLSRGLARAATAQEQTAALRRSGAAMTVSPVGTSRLPWLALLLAPLLVASQVLAPRNPANPLLGPGSRLSPRLATALSWSRMWGIWQALSVRSLLAGSYPATLRVLVEEGLLPERALRDPWDRPYRLVLGERSILLAGSTARGAPDPNLLLEQALPEPGATSGGGRGVAILEP